MNQRTRRRLSQGTRGVFVVVKEEEPWHPERDGFSLRVLSVSRGEPFPYAVEFDVDGFRTIVSAANIEPAAKMTKQGGH